MEDRNHIKSLYQKYLSNQCTDKEMESLFQYFHTSSEEELKQLVMHALEETDHMTTDTTHQERAKLSQLYNSLHSQIHVQKPGRIQIRSRKNPYYRIAAAAAVFILVFVGSWFYIHKEEDEILVAHSSVLTDIGPGGNKALLTLSNGKKISLTDLMDGEISGEAGVSINKLDDGQLVYTVVHSGIYQKDSPQYNVIETPRGGQYQVVLPDGTRIWLNASSSLRFPTVFVGNERIVELIGEAYFEVAENRNMPLKVISKEQEVKVLGTHFNINAYPEEESIKTTLLEGSVKVQLGKYSTTLLPGQQALANQIIQIKDADVQEAVAWKNGRTQFSNADIRTIMRMLSRWYDVDVDYQGKIISTGFSGSVSRSKNISEILKLLELTGDVHFKIEGRRVLVMP